LVTLLTLDTDLALSTFRTTVGENDGFVIAEAEVGGEVLDEQVASLVRLRSIVGPGMTEAGGAEPVPGIIATGFACGILLGDEVLTEMMLDDGISSPELISSESLVTESFRSASSFRRPSTRSL